MAIRSIQIIPVHTRRAALFLVAAAAFGQTDFDLLLKGGHVVDPKNRVNAVRDIGIKDGKIAEVAANIAANRALKTVDVSPYYVTPGPDRHSRSHLRRNRHRVYRPLERAPG